MFKFLPLQLFFAFLFHSSFSNIPTITINDEQGTLDLIEHVAFYYDEESKLDFQSILNFSEWSKLTKPGQKLFLSFYKSGNLWVTFSLKNNSQNYDEFIFDIPNATINNISLYKENDKDGYELIETGASHSYSTRDLKTRAFSYYLKVPFGEERRYILKINGEGDAINLPLKIHFPKTYIKQLVHEKYLLGIYYGSILFIIIFHAFLYLKLRDKALIFYMLYVAGFAGYQLNMDGFVSKYFLQDFPYLAKRTLSMFVYLSSASLVAFLQLYLKTASFIPRFNKVLNFLKWFCWAGLVLCLLHYKIYIVLQHTINLFAPVITILAIIGAFLCYKNQPILSKYFITAFLFLMGGIVIEVIKNMGIGYLSDYGVKAGHAGEAIILAFALAVRFKLEDEKTQALALQRLENLNELKDQYSAQLEETVIKRTEELNISNKSINDSIRYARHIQYSLLPSTNLLDSYLPEYFILYKPKDIVSGDFYWFEKIENKLVIAVVDCTGHGVPGAFMSMLGSNILRDIVKTKGLINPGYILKNLDVEVKEALKQSSTDPLHKDGMDVCLISYDFDDKTLNFAGAKRPLIFVSNQKEMHIFKGNKQSVGGELFRTSSNVYDSINLPISGGDTVYLFTDGLVDQFGGNKDKKFLFSRFKDTLNQIQHLSMKEQGKIIEQQFEDWKGNQEQIDDILVMGIKF